MSTAETRVEIIFKSLEDCQGVYQLFKKHTPRKGSKGRYARSNNQLKQLGFEPGGLFTDTADLWVVDIFESVIEKETDATFSLTIDFNCGHRVGYKLIGELFNCFTELKVKSITTAQLNDSMYFWSFACRIGDKECHFSVAEGNDSIYDEFTEKNYIKSIKRICMDNRLNALVNNRKC